MIVELKSLLPEIAEALSERENAVSETVFSAPPPSPGAAFFQMPRETVAFEEAFPGSSAEKESAGSRITFLLEQLVGISERNAVFTEKTAELLEQQENGQTPSFS